MTLNNSPKLRPTALLPHPERVGLVRLTNFVRIPVLSLKTRCFQASGKTGSRRAVDPLGNKSYKNRA